MGGGPAHRTRPSASGPVYADRHGRAHQARGDRRALQAAGVHLPGVGDLRRFRATPTTTGTTASYSRTTSRTSGGARCCRSATTSSLSTRRSSRTPGSGRRRGISPASRIPLVQCLGECKQRFREDDLREEQLGSEDAEGEIRCPVCGGELSEPRQFNLMFETYVGPVQDESNKAYLRPETAQGIFINFKNVLQFARKKPPFGIAQIGKSFRNEITPGNFIFRTFEFEQMEMEFFVPPAETDRVARLLDGAAAALVHRPRHPAREAPAPSPRRRRALPLLERDLGRRVPLPDGLVGARGDRQPRRLRPHPARQVLRREARVRRLGVRAIATSPTWSSPRPASTGRCSAS